MNNYSMGDVTSSGVLFVFIFISVVDVNSFLTNTTISSGNNSIFQIICTIVVAASAVPLGYVFSQIWMTIYNLLFDVHNKVFDDSSKEQFENELESIFEKGGRWKKGLILELKLALLHRHDTKLDSDQFLGWHRNRLNQLHSNGAIILSLLCSTAFCIALSMFSSSTLIIHPLSKYLELRWWVYAFVLITIICCFINANRAYTMIVLYNKSAIYAKCGNCESYCRLLSHRTSTINKQPQKMSSKNSKRERR